MQLPSPSFRRGSASLERNVSSAMAGTSRSQHLTGSFRRGGSIPLPHADVAAMVASGVLGTSADLVDVDAVPHDVAQKIEQLLRDDPSQLGGTAMGAAASPVRGMDAAAATETNGTGSRCGEHNKHIVVGALDVLDTLRNSVPLLLESEPLLASVLFLLCMVLQRYEPPVRVESAFAVPHNLPWRTRGCVDAGLCLRLNAHDQQMQSQFHAKGHGYAMYCITKCASAEQAHAGGQRDGRRGH